MLEVSGDGNKVVQLSYVFTQQAQWRNLLEQPELFSALQPNDVRPAGTCDIQLAETIMQLGDAIRCSGSTPRPSYTRVQHGEPVELDARVARQGARV